jgi:hypothetical protein
MVLKPPVKRWSSLPIHYHDQSLTERGVDVLPASEKGFQVTRFKRRVFSAWLKEARCLFISSIYYPVLAPFTAFIIASLLFGALYIRKS